MSAQWGRTHVAFSFLNERGYFELFCDFGGIMNGTIGTEVTTSSIGSENGVEMKLSDEIARLLTNRVAKYV